MTAGLTANALIQREYEGIDGAMRPAPAATIAALREAFGVTGADRALPGPVPALRAPARTRCHLPAFLARGRAWGVALQLYQIRSARNWGIGDFADLATLGRLLGAAGADFVGVNPLHALFLANPAHCSPFSPSNRRFLNPLYVAVDLLPEATAADVEPAALAAVRAAAFVDYPEVARLKLEALRRCWGRTDRKDPAFARFRAAGGASLERHACFEALSLHLGAEGHGAGWRDWPEAFRNPEDAAVQAFAAEEADTVAFHAWLQFVADRQLAAAQEAALSAGMRLGLYLDFAVGEAPDGSGSWSDRAMVVPGVHVGAPPDYFNAGGQDWGLAPMSPVAMAESRAAPFRALMEDATRRAGALRIDHAMALWQLFLIPEGATPAEGTYVRYPLEDMIRALAAASQENRTVIIGEDLGNVPRGFRPVMDAVDILSYRILLFERDDDGFIPPDAYPRNALVCLSTHDLPTFRGWWQGEDVALRASFGLIDAAAAAAQRDERQVERRDLLADLAAAGRFDAAAPADDPPEDLVVAVHAHLAAAPSRLFAARLEDIAGEREPVNLPSTVDEYPNWRRRLSVPLEELDATPLWRGITAALRAARPRETP